MKKPVKSINWKFRQNISTKRGTLTAYRDEKLKVQMETWTSSHGQKNYYFIDNDKREFKTENELLDAINSNTKQ